MRDRLIGVGAPDLARNSLCERIGVTASPHKQVIRAGAPLQQRKKKFWFSLTLYIEVTHIRSNADDFVPFMLALARSGNTDAFPEHVKTAPIFSRHGLIYDYDFGGVSHISLIKLSSADQGNAEYPEILWRDIALHNVSLQETLVR